MKHKVSELEGPLLDAAVAKADGRTDVFMWGDSPCFEGGGGMPGSNVTTYKPSSSWAQGGPVIDRERITIAACSSGPDPLDWMASMNYSSARTRTFGSTPLVAAMRVYVASKFGNEVDLPA